MEFKNFKKDNCILVLYDSYSFTSIDTIDEDKLILVDTFPGTPINDIIKNLEYLYMVSENCQNLAFVIINKPDSTFLYKIAI